MRIEVWTDVVCPYCYVAKHELAKALAGFEHAEAVEVVWKSLQLEDDASSEGVDATDFLVAKYGISVEDVITENEQLAVRAAELGLDYNWGDSLITNSLDAHRLVKLAETQGLADEANERFMRAYFTDGELLSDRDTLLRLGTEVGLDADRMTEVLDGVEFTEQVHTDMQQAAAYEIEGVPFFLFEGKWAVSGAQPAELFSEALRQVWDETHRPKLITLGAGFEESAGGCCGGGGGGCGCGAR